MSWPARKVDERLVAGFAVAAGLSPLMARLLWLRGVRTAVQARQWLSPGLDDLYPPEMLPDFEPGAARILSAIEKREKILIWGHDDLDGITAVAIMKRVLEGLRAEVCYAIPVRGLEKHGLDADRVSGFVKEGVGLVITVDCGITNRDDIAKLARRGVDVIVTDHHELPEGLPPALASIDPKRPDSSYGYRGLAGVGVALKFALGLIERRLGIAPTEFWTVDPDAVALAVLGTISDRVPLTGENRTLVACGVRQLHDCRLAAVREILARLDCRENDGRYAPVTALPRLLRLFAAADGMAAVDRLLYSDSRAAAHWLDELESRAREWQAEAEQAWTLAQVVARVGDGLIIVKDRRMPLRALGYCSNRLRAGYQLPALVMGWRGDAWVGECRGTEGMSLIELLNAHRDYFLDYGGHRIAAGFSIADDRVEEFITAAERYAHLNFAREVAHSELESVDAFLPLTGFEPAVCRLAPFGEGNPRPLFASETVWVTADREHWVASTRPDLQLHPADTDVVLPTVPVQLLYTVDDIGRLMVKDSRPA